MKKELNNAGFSLLEVVLAMAILAIISIPLLSYFSDSMKYNVKMADKQHATTLAQEIAESLKAQDKLVQNTAGVGVPVSYGVPYLLDHGYQTDASVTDTISGSGVGEVQYYGAAANTGNAYDVKVKINTDTKKNGTELPQIYGIDDTSDALVVEDSQFDQALAYFCAVNTTYAQAHSEVPESEDNIKKNIRRKVTVTIQKDIGGSGFEVVARADYRCSGLQGSGSGDEVFDLTDDLLNIHLSKLHAIYYLYNVQTCDDTLEIKRMDPTIKETPQIHIVCQDTTAIPASGYKFHLTMDYLSTLAGGENLVYTNLGASGLDPNILVDENGLAISAKEELVSKAKEIRNADIQIMVYEKGKGLASGEEPYITVNTSKGE